MAGSVRLIAFPKRAEQVMPVRKPDRVYPWPVARQKPHSRSGTADHAHFQTGGAEIVAVSGVGMC
jgi:hypothetical protein